MIPLSEVFNKMADAVNTDTVSEWTPLRLSDEKDPVKQQEYLSLLQAKPQRFLGDVLGVTKTWAGQDALLEALATHSRVAVASGHALGKDFISARSILWFLYCFMPAIVIATAPTDRQVEKVIWGELEQAFHQSLKPLPGRPLSKQLIVNEHLRWYAMGFTTKDVKRSPGKFQGFHQKNVLVLFSEAQAIDRAIWEQAESLMTGANVKLLAIGNPLINFGPFYEACQPGSGFKTLRLDCEDSPNVIEGREVIPGLCSRQWVEYMAQKHGKDSVTYRAKVKGIAPPKATDAFIEAPWVDYAANSGYELSKTNGLRVAGVDPSGQGRAKTVIVIRDGMRVIEMRKREKPSDGGRKQLTTELTGEIVVLLNDGVHRVYIDVGGIGLAIYERVVEQDPRFVGRIIPINFGSTAPDLPQDEFEGYKTKHRFKDMGTMMYWRVAKLLENSLMGLPNDPDLHSQLVTRKMELQSDGRWKLESKEDYAERGFESPDEADATVLAYCNVEPNQGGVEPFGEIDETTEDSISEIWKI